ncbi:MAG: transglutaminase domain-containing protein [Pseudomonadota bacterium]
MKTPPFLLSAALVFWGWQTDSILLAVLMVPVVESARFIKTRWVLSLSDFYRTADIATLFLLGIAMYALFTDPRSIIMMSVKWLPLMMLPLMAAQEYSTEGKIDTRAFMMLARKEPVIRDNPSSIDFSYPYFFLCMMAAASANQRTALFYSCFVLLAAWAMFPCRSKRYPFAVWCVFILLSIGLGYMTHNGLRRMQGVLMHWAGDLFLTDSNPFKSTTAIGEIGEVKQSDRIIFRMDRKAENLTGILMQEAVYNRYLSSVWFAGRSESKELQPENNGNTWRLAPEQKNADTMTVSAYLKQGSGILKLPANTFEIIGRPGLKLRKTRLGAVMVEEGPDLIRYTLRYGREPIHDQIPDDRDLYVPQEEMPGITKFIAELGLSGKSPEETLRVLQSFFQENFTYTLDLTAQQTGRAPVSGFLLSDRSGHCEYFATAAALVLRACGIPARYVRGFLAHEYSPMEKAVIVRSRHAHAWTLVHINGKWRPVDTTPSSWISTEEEAMSPMHMISDMFSYGFFLFSQWRWSEDSASWKPYSLILLLPLVIILVKRIHSRKKIHRVTLLKDSKSRKDKRFRIESGFDPVEKEIQRLGFPRYPWETMQGWITRIRDKLPETVSSDMLMSALHLHYRSRFGQHGLNAGETQELAALVEAILN